jgi:hypothetical protein
VTRVGARVLGVRGALGSAAVVGVKAAAGGGNAVGICAQETVACRATAGSAVVA